MLMAQEEEEEEGTMRLQEDPHLSLDLVRPLHNIPKAHMVVGWAVDLWEVQEGGVQLRCM